MYRPVSAGGVDRCVHNKTKELIMSGLKKLGILNREGMKACNQGRLEDAMFQLVQAGLIAKKMDSPLHEAKVRNNIGLVHQLTGDFDGARASFRLAQHFAVKGAGKGNSLEKTISRNLNRLERTVDGRAA